MSIRNFIVVLAVVMFAVLPARADLADSSKAKTSSHSIKKLKIDIPQNIDERMQAAIIEKLTGMEKQRFVYLDLSVHYEVGSMPYSVMIDGKPTNTVDDNHALLMGTGVTYHLGSIANYNHLILSVFTGERSAFPYQDISREYTGKPDQSVFHIRGFFHVIGNSIPTAAALQLRPVNPPFDTVVKVLAR